MMSFMRSTMDPCSRNPCPLQYACKVVANVSFACIYEPLSTLPTPCTQTVCFNGGSCIAAFPSNICLCPVEWTGDDCSVRNPNTDYTEYHRVQQLHHVAVAIGVLVTAFLLAFLLVLCCHCKSSRRWTVFKEQCKHLLGQPRSTDIEPIVDISSVQKARLCPEVVYFTAAANQEETAGAGTPVMQQSYYAVDERPPISSLTGRPLITGSAYAAAHHMEHLRV
ncbi:delta and Notch-like epidermal growth factor-related receptor [Paramacrobiotus metropolitanus]|uniref:delta and Notch-like epidermal growth factor-related receptor n=1 Tax=Paramacrobiotus metropolitanus TaxID=2943436 RepID=UPI002445E598|nr:delta and Notch-like epidermal growth factor-related receptor [Paramacrobiotus metropolitanus]